MKYDELLEKAREWDVPPDVGPSFDDLAAAAGLPAVVGPARTPGSPAAAAGVSAKKIAGWCFGGLLVVGGVAVGVSVRSSDGSTTGAPGDGRVDGRIRRSARVAEAPAALPPVERIPMRQRAAAAGGEESPREPDAGDGLPEGAREAAEGTAPSSASKRRTSGRRSSRRRAGEPRGTDPEALYREVEARLARGQRRAARRKLEQLVRRHRGWRGHATAVFDLAHLAEQLDDPEGAYCAYVTLLRLHPGDPLAAEAARGRDRLGGAVDLRPQDCR